MDTASRIVQEPEAEVIRAYSLHIGGPVPEGDNIHITRWARLSLPNGQIAQSAWKECAKPLNKVRMARNIKVSRCRRQESSGTDLLVLQYSQQQQFSFASVLYYFRLTIHDEIKTLALDFDLLQKSYHTLWLCESLSDAGLEVIDLQRILSVVAMVPHLDNHFFVYEKIGLDIADMGGYREDPGDEE
jgi:hypothetical protein